MNWLTCKVYSIGVDDQTVSLKQIVFVSSERRGRVARRCRGERRAAVRDGATDPVRSAGGPGPGPGPGPVPDPRRDHSRRWGPAFICDRWCFWLMNELIRVNYGVDWSVNIPAVHLLTSSEISLQSSQNRFQEYSSALLSTKVKFKCTLSLLAQLVKLTQSETSVL